MADSFSLPQTLQDLLRDEIAPEERVRWVTRPQAGSGFCWMMLPPVLFAVPWTLFSLFWMFGAAGGFDGGPIAQERLLFAAFGIPFVLVGLALLSTPLWIRRQLRKAADNTLYVITDRRAIVFNGGYFGGGGLALMSGFMLRMMRPGLIVQSFPPDQLRTIERVQRHDGSGDLMFGGAAMPLQWDRNPLPLRVGFYSIPDVREVERLLKELAAKSEPN